MIDVILKKGREASLLRRHPWIFSGAIEKIKGAPESGATARVLAADGRKLAIGALSPKSQIRVRVWSVEADRNIDKAFFRQRLTAAIEARRNILNDPARNACRLVYAESDGLPGLIVDRYGDYLVCQFLFAGVEYWKDAIIAALSEVFPCRGIYERSDAGVREKEGLSSIVGLRYGDEPPTFIEIVEGFCRYRVDVRQGHKTGFYLDQGDNRAAVATLAQDRQVLNCFAYSGGFGVAALQGGASFVTNLDASQPALDLAKENFAINGFGEARYENLCGNAFEVLRSLHTEGRRFGMIILDPPKFADSKNHLQRGARAYKDIALQAARLLEPGGILATFSCSGAIDMSLFQKITFDGVLDAGREGQVIRYLYQSGDHPVALHFPESLYLKGLICKIN
jgi:23S rRNA (cytosine1962-C5)-methyltransferase